MVLIMIMRLFKEDGFSARALLASSVNTCEDYAHQRETPVTYAGMVNFSLIVFHVVVLYNAKSLLLVL